LATEIPPKKFQLWLENHRFRTFMVGEKTSAKDPMARGSLAPLSPRPHGEAELLSEQRPAYSSEKGKTEPVAAQFKPVVAFLGYDPTPEPQTLAERVEARQRRLGVSFAQIARYLGWEPGSLKRYLDGTWRISVERRGALEAFLDAEDGGSHGATFP
jgi:hypothetical protein